MKISLSITFCLAITFVGICQKPIRWNPNQGLSWEVAFGLESIFLKDALGNQAIIKSIYYEPLIGRFSSKFSFGLAFRIGLREPFYQNDTFLERSSNGLLGNLVDIPQATKIGFFGYSLHLKYYLLNYRVRLGLDWGNVTFSYKYKRLQYDPKKYSELPSTIIISPYGELSPYAGINFRVGLLRCFIDISHPIRWRLKDDNWAPINRPFLWLRTGIIIPGYQKDLIHLDIYDTDN